VVTHPLADGNRFARNHGLIERAGTLRHNAVDRNLLAWSYAKEVADMDVSQWNVLFCAVGVDTPRGLRRQSQQCLDGSGRLRPSLQFEQLPDVNEIMTAAASKYTLTRPCAANASGKTPGTTVAMTL
jgi:hypothetical protein